jgi:hypothetical protein
MAFKKNLMHLEQARILQSFHTDTESVGSLVLKEHCYENKLT